MTALLTAVVAVASVGLWGSTRALVLGAEATARRQLRAYVGTRGYGFAEATKGEGRTAALLGEAPRLRFSVR